MKQEKHPKIGIGMPVLNGEAVIGRALDDLLDQTFTDFEIVVCDNASEDRTRAIVESYMEKDERIRLLAFDERADIMLSFKRAYDNCSAPYFLFAPADDRWYRGFLEETLAVLERNPDIIACTGRVAFISRGRFSHITSGTRPLMGDTRQNLASYMSDPAENARAFSLIRHRALEGAFPKAEYPGWDFQMIARTLPKGRYCEIPRVLAERDTTTYAAYLKHAEAYFGWSPLRFFPLSRTAIEVWRDRRIPKSLPLARALVRLVVSSHLSYAAMRLPRWHRFLLALLGRDFQTRIAARQRAGEADQAESGG